MHLFILLELCIQPTIRNLLKNVRERGALFFYFKGTFNDTSSNEHAKVIFPTDLIQNKRASSRCLGGGVDI